MKTALTLDCLTDTNSAMNKSEYEAIGSLSNDDDDGNENVILKYNFSVL